MFHLRGADAFQQRAGRFVVGVLWHELAGEGGLEDVFALGGGLLESVLDGSFLLDALDQRALHTCDDLIEFVQWW